jgi:hypothetical protein
MASEIAHGARVALQTKAQAGRLARSNSTFENCKDQIVNPG